MCLRNSQPLLVACLLVTFAASSAWAQTAQVAGEWDLFLSAAQAPARGEEPDTCDFSGQAAVTQSGADFMGDADLTLDQGGPDVCPPLMMASLTGTVIGNELSGQLIGEGQLGTADFTGTVGTRGTPPDTPDITGTINVPPGQPFGGFAGDWFALMRGGPSTLEIPTLTGVGLTVLVALILAVGALLLRRRTSEA